MNDLLIQKTAVISKCGRYRYELTRRWADGPLLTFVMLNPSTADADVDDPTIRRCMSFARRESYAGIYVANLFAYRATKPKALELADNPYGPENFEYLGYVIRNSRVICAWGAHQDAVNPGRVFCKRAKSAHVDLFSLGRTKGGFPSHPLYVRSDKIIEPFEWV